MELMTPPLVWAQTQPAAVNPNSIALLALRRWFSSLTLSSPQPVPGLHGLWAFLAGLGFLLVVALFFQGPVAVLKQLFDLPGHVRLVRDGDAAGVACRPDDLDRDRLYRVILDGQSVAWSSSRDSGRRLDLTLLTKSRRLGELALEQGILAGMTPLRDVAGLGDNLPLLIFAAIMLFRASLDLPGWGISAGRRRRRLAGAEAHRAGRH